MAARANKKPVAAVMLVLVGGILVLLGGILFAALGAALFSLIQLAGVGSLLGIIGIVSGLAMIFSAFMMWSTDPMRVRMWGVIAIIFSLLSIANGGGFVIGFILGVVGSIMAFAYMS